MAPKLLAACCTPYSAHHNYIFIELPKLSTGMISKMIFNLTKTIFVNFISAS
jgi:hypothetical protein